MFNNFNPHAPIGNSPFGTTTDEQLLEQLRHMAAYGGHNQTTLMLLHELHMRAARSFSKAFVPDKEVQGGSFLYTSIFKDGVMTHFFVSNEETKRKIEEIFETTKVKGARGEDEFGAERIGLLMELGDVFRTVPVDEHGKQVGPIKRCGFGSLFGGKGFNEEPRHPSKVLPLVVIEVPTLTLLHVEQSNFCLTVMSSASQLIHSPDQLSKLDGYMRYTPVLKEYLVAVSEVMKLKEVGINHSYTTQIHLFPADMEAPLKFLGGVGEKLEWDAGFIKREQYPNLFPGMQNYVHPNGSVGGLGGFNGFGPSNARSQF